MPVLINCSKCTDVCSRKSILSKGHPAGLVCSYQAAIQQQYVYLVLKAVLASSSLCFRVISDIGSVFVKDEQASNETQSNLFVFMDT